MPDPGPLSFVRDVTVGLEFYRPTLKAADTSYQFRADRILLQLLQAKRPKAFEQTSHGPAKSRAEEYVIYLEPDVIVRLPAEKPRAPNFSSHTSGNHLGGAATWKSLFSVMKTRRRQARSECLADDDLSPRQQTLTVCFPAVPDPKPPPSELQLDSRCDDGEDFLILATLWPT